MADVDQQRWKRWAWRAATVVGAMAVAGAVAVAVAWSERPPGKRQQTAQTAKNRPASDIATGSAEEDTHDSDTQHERVASADSSTTANPAEDDNEDNPLAAHFPTGHRPTAIDRDASQSVGTPQNGHLRGGVGLDEHTLPALQVLTPTRGRGFTHGTAEIVALIRDVASAVAAAHPGSVMTVGNLSRPGGGDIPQSVSHNSGRDADIAFFLRDTAGKPFVQARMRHIDDNGVTHGPNGEELRFDVARNWAVIRHLLSHPGVIVQWVFVSAALRNMLLDHALRIGEPELLQERARRVMVQPSDSSRHDDHFHVRIACPPGDRPACVQGAGRTARARDAQIDALLRMYRAGSPAEQRYAREMLSLPVDGADFELPPLENR